MISDRLFMEFVKAASLAASADNMQPWEFRKKGDSIEVFCVKERICPTDVIDMFGWVGVGAAIQNIVEEAGANGLLAEIEYGSIENIYSCAAIIKFKEEKSKDNLAKWIESRNTNRSHFDRIPLEQGTINKLNKNLDGFSAGIHWNNATSALDKIAYMDANSTYIRLEHKPLHDELFDILRFSRKEMEKIRFGLDFRSLEVPPAAVFVAQQLKYWAINKTVSRLGIGRIVAKQLSAKLKSAGALCMVTAKQRNAIGYMEAGRAMEKLWLAATAEGLSIQPYGVLPQYLTKAEMEPETFLPKHVEALEKHREPFFSIFPKAKNEFPAIVLRVGKAHKQSPRSDVRLKLEQVIRKN